MEIVVNRKGIPHIVLYDDADHGLLKSYIWHINQSGYAVGRIIGTGRCSQIRMSRLILGITSKDIVVDHINHNTLDNRRINIRPATRSDNMKNRRPSGRSLYLGVGPYRNRCKNGNGYCKPLKFRAYITIGSKNTHLGYFSTAMEAALAYDAAAKEHHGEFANLNFKPCSI